jgi:hypothetical protein
MGWRDLLYLKTVAQHGEEDEELHREQDESKDGEVV